MKKAFSVFTGGNTNNPPTNSSTSSRLTSSFGALFGNNSSSSNATASSSLPSVVNTNDHSLTTVTNGSTHNETKGPFASLSSTTIASPAPSFAKSISLSNNSKGSSSKFSYVGPSPSSKLLLSSSANSTTGKSLDVLLYEFHTYSNQLEILHDAVEHIYSCMDNLCTSLLTVAEAITPLASSYANLKSEASEYLNATTLLTSMLLPVIHKSLKQLLLHPLQSILASHNELKNRIEDRNKAQIDYDLACIELQKLQKKVVSNRKKSTGNSNTYENSSNDPKALAAQAKVVSKLTSSQALVTALSEALTDELKTLSTRRKEVVTRLFLGISSILQTFTFGSAASFMDCDFAPILQSLQSLAEEMNDDGVKNVASASNISSKTITTEFNVIKDTPQYGGTGPSSSMSSDTATVPTVLSTAAPTIPTAAESTDELSTINNTSSNSVSVTPIDTTMTTTTVLNRASSPIAFALAAISSVVSPLTSSSTATVANPHKIQLPSLTYHTDKLDSMVNQWINGPAWWDEGKASRNNAKAAYSRKRAAQRKLFEVTGIQRRIPLSAYLVAVSDDGSHGSSSSSNLSTVSTLDPHSSSALSSPSSTILTLQRPANTSVRDIVLQNIAWETYLAQYITLPDLIRTSQISKTLQPLLTENSAPWLALLTAGGLRISYTPEQNEYYRRLRVRFWLRCLGSDNYGAPAPYSLMGIYRRKTESRSSVSSTGSVSTNGFLPSSASSSTTNEIPPLKDAWVKPVNEDSLQALLQLAKAESAIGGKGEGVPSTATDGDYEGSASDDQDMLDEHNVVRWLTLIEQDVNRSYTEGVPFGISGAILRARKAAMKDRTIPLKALLEYDEESVQILRRNAHRRLHDELTGNYKYHHQHHRSNTYRRRNIRAHRRRSLPYIPLTDYSSKTNPVDETSNATTTTTNNEFTVSDTTDNDIDTVPETFVPSPSHNPYMNPYASVIQASPVHHPVPTVQFRSGYSPSTAVYGAQYSFAHVITADNSSASSSLSSASPDDNTNLHPSSSMDEALSPTEPPVSISLSAFLGGQVVTPSAYAAAAMARKGTVSRRTKEEETSRGKLRRSSAFTCYANYVSSSSTESNHSSGHTENNNRTETSTEPVLTTVNEASDHPSETIASSFSTVSVSNEDTGNTSNIEGSAEWVQHRRQCLHQVLLAIAATEPELRYTQGMNAVSRMVLEILIQGGSAQPVLDTVNVMRALLDCGSHYHDQNMTTILEILRDNKRIQTNNTRNTNSSSATSTSSTSSSSSSFTTLFNSTNLPTAFLYYVAAPRLRSLFAPDMVHLRLRIYQVDRLLLRRSPELHAHLASEGIQCSTFAAPWLLTLFTNFTALDASSTATVWDKFLIEGWAPILRMCLAVLATLAPLLLDAPMEDCLPALHAPRLYYSSISSSWIISSPSLRRRFPHTVVDTDQDQDDYYDNDDDHDPSSVFMMSSSTGAATHQSTNSTGTNKVTETIMMEQLLYRMDNDPLCSVTNNDLIDLEIDYYTYGDRYM